MLGGRYSTRLDRVLSDDDLADPRRNEEADDRLRRTVGKGRWAGAFSGGGYAR
jgi:hypothetical protein